SNPITNNLFNLRKPASSWGGEWIMHWSPVPDLSDMFPNFLCKIRAKAYRTTEQPRRVMHERPPTPKRFASILACINVSQSTPIVKVFALYNPERVEASQSTHWSRADMSSKRLPFLKFALRRPFEIPLPTTS